MGDRFWHKADVGSHGALLGSSACLTWLLWGEGVCVQGDGNSSQMFQVSDSAGIFPDGCLSAGSPGNGLLPHLRADHRLAVGEGSGGRG